MSVTQVYIVAFATWDTEQENQGFSLAISTAFQPRGTYSRWACTCAEWGGGRSTAFHGQAGPAHDGDGQRQQHLVPGHHPGDSAQQTARAFPGCVAASGPLHCAASLRPWYAVLSGAGGAGARSTSWSRLRASRCLHRCCNSCCKALQLQRLVQGLPATCALPHAPNGAASAVPDQLGAHRDISRDGRMRAAQRLHASSRRGRSGCSEAVLASGAAPCLHANGSISPR